MRWLQQLDVRRSRSADCAAFAPPPIDVHQPAAAFDAARSPAAKSVGCSSDVEDQLPPRNASTNPASAHEPEATPPAIASASAMPNSGPKIHSEEYCEALKIAHAPPRSAVGNHAATMRPLPGNTGDCASPETSRSTKIALNAHAAGKVPGKSDKKRAHRPRNDADAIHPLRSEAVQQAARRQLPAHIRPTESRRSSIPSFSGSSASSFSIGCPATESATRSP